MSHHYLQAYLNFLKVFLEVTNLKTLVRAFLVEDTAFLDLPSFPSP